MSDTITITGLVATAPRHIVTSEGLAITTFRLASAQRRFDRAQERWIDADTNWCTITSFRQLAIHAAGSLDKGDRVLVTGRLRIREWDSGERKGINIDVEADAIGHDLMWGTSKFSRSVTASAAPKQADEATAESESPSSLDPDAGAQPDAQPDAQPATAAEAPAGSAAGPTPEPLAALPY